jgi:hypothetical protein
VSRWGQTIAPAGPAHASTAGRPRAASGIVGRTRKSNRLFDLRRAPWGSSLTIGVFAGCSATVLGGGSCSGFGIRRRRVSLA